MSDDELKKWRNNCYENARPKTAGAANSLDPGCGCAALVRNSKYKEHSADEARVEFHGQQTQLPFLTGVRETMFPELKNGAPLEPHATFSSWCDGGIAQTKATTKLKNMEHDEKSLIIGNKQSVSRSVVEQPAGIGGQHLSSKVMSKRTTLKNDP